MGRLLPRAQISPTRQRIIAISMMLTLLVQFVLTYFSTSYMNTMNGIIHDKKNHYIVNQFHQNMMLQFEEINQLLQLLQTPDYSGFFRGAMNVRDASSVARQRAALRDKINGLHLSQTMVRKIFFIGSDANQLSFVKDTSADDFTELYHVRMDVLQELGVSSIFLKENHRLMTYSEDMLPNLEPGDISEWSAEGAEEIVAFLNSMTDTLLITNGNMNGVLIIIELDPDYLGGGLKDEFASAYLYSNGDQGETLIWSSVQDPADRAAMRADCPHCFKVEKELAPYPYRIVLMAEQPSSYSLPSRLSTIGPFILFSVVSIAITFVVSILYTRSVFAPYYRLSRRMEKQSRSYDLSLRPISDPKATSGIHALSMRTNLMLIFTIAVFIPALSQGGLYARALDRFVDSRLETSVAQMGEYARNSAQLRMESIEHLMNQLSVSEQLQQYLMQRRMADMTAGQVGAPSLSPIHSASYPGMDKVKYVVIFDENGKGIYSSIFSTEQDIFKIDPDYLLDQRDLYWISGYKDIFQHTSMAVVKEVQVHLGGTSSRYYLFMVPGETLLQDLASVDTAIQLKDERSGQIVHSPAMHGEEPTFAWAGSIDGTPWQLVFEYSSKEIMLKYRQYVYFFLFLLILILVVSSMISYLISSVMTKPLEQLFRTMALVGEGDFKQTPSYSKNNEIGDIIRSYNEMMRKLQDVIRDNMKIMEESANTKIRENELLSMKDRAELQMLQAQINPHFLYNTLEAINMLSLKIGNREISQMVIALAELFRYSVSGGPGKVPLAKELDQVQNYISIQQMRYREQFRYEMDVPESLLKFEVVKFILQPIIENSLKHGLSGFEEGGRIRLIARDEGESISLTVQDNGIGMSAAKVAKLNEDLKQGPAQTSKSTAQQGGIGLRNVYHRLQLFYREQAEMVVTSRPMNGTQVMILIPKDGKV